MSQNHERLTAEQIQQQMNFVRRELDGDVEQVVEDAQSLADVRAYIKARPLAWMAAAAIAGYLIVPSRKSGVKQNLSSRSHSTNENTAKGSMIGAALELAATMGGRVLVQKVAEAGVNMFANMNQPVRRSSSDSVGNSLNKHAGSSDNRQDWKGIPR